MPDPHGQGALHGTLPPASHPAILPRDLWERVQAKLDANKSDRSNAPRCAEASGFSISLRGAVARTRWPSLLTK